VGVSSAQGEDDVVSLPPLFVEERERPLHWRYAAAGGIEVLSLCDDDVTREFLRRCLQLDHALTVLLPERFQFRTSVPRAQILFNEDLGRARSQEVMKEMLQREGLESPPASRTIRLPDLPRLQGQRFGFEPARVYFLPNLRLSDVDAEIVFAATHESDPGQLQFTFVVDRIEYLLERRVPALPDWFVEGLLGLYEQCRLGPASIEFDPAVWLSADESRAVLTEDFHPRTLLPAAEIFARRRRPSIGVHDDLTKIWRAQCALFVRWALVAQDGARQPGLWRLLDRLEHEPMTEGLLTECLGVGFADLRDQLSDYLPEALRRRATLRVPPMPDLPEVKPRAAKDVEVARIRGDWERLEIIYVRARWPGVADRYVEQARRTLQNAYRDGARDPELLAIIGLTEYDARNPEGGRAYLEAAARAGVARPRIYVELARERLEQAIADVGEGKLTRVQVDRILEPLRGLDGLEPRLASVYAIIAEAWTRSEEQPSEEELSALTDGLRRFPRVAPLVSRGVLLNIKAGRLGAALDLARRGAWHAEDEETRGKFERIVEQLERDRDGAE
jgi:hypothetical protein